MREKAGRCFRLTPQVGEVLHAAGTFKVLPQVYSAAPSSFCKRHSGGSALPAMR